MSSMSCGQIFVDTLAVCGALGVVGAIGFVVASVVAALLDG